MLKLIATWALSTKIVGIWSQQLLVMKGAHLIIFCFLLASLVRFHPSDAFVNCYACMCRCLTVSPNFEIAKNNMAIALTDLGTKVWLPFYLKLCLYRNPADVPLILNISL